MSGHQEIIVCPECKSDELADVQHTEPFWTYIHNCKKCSRIIMESEWERKFPPKHQ